MNIFQNTLKRIVIGTVAVVSVVSLIELPQAQALTYVRLIQEPGGRIVYQTRTTYLAPSYTPRRHAPVHTPYTIRRQLVYPNVAGQARQQYLLHLNQQLHRHHVVQPRFVTPRSSGSGHVGHVNRGMIQDH